MENNAWECSRRALVTTNQRIVIVVKVRTFFEAFKQVFEVQSFVIRFRPPLSMAFLPQSAIPLSFRSSSTACLNLFLGLPLFLQFVHVQQYTTCSCEKTIRFLVHWICWGRRFVSIAYWKTKPPRTQDLPRNVFVNVSVPKSEEESFHRFPSNPKR